jgi:hypothetical protein
VRLNPPFLGTASASVSGSVMVGPFGSFNFATGNQSGGGSFGISASLTGGGISLGVPPSGNTAGQITFTGFTSDIQPNTFYPFSMSGALTSSLSGTGVTGTAYAIANIYSEQFNLRANEELVSIPEPSSFWLLAIGGCGLLGWIWRSLRSRGQRVSQLAA